MIKIDYEGAWKELKENMNLSSLPLHMNEIEKKYTCDFIDIRRRSDKEIADYCLKKYTEIFLENIHLKRKEKEKEYIPRRNQLFHVIMILKRIKDGYKYKWEENMGEKRFEEYREKFLNQEIFQWDGKDITIIEFNISYP